MKYRIVCCLVALSWACASCIFGVSTETSSTDSSDVGEGSDVRDAGTDAGAADGESGLGACDYGDASEGVCSNQSRTDAGECARPEAYESDEKTCDGLDNDCDGSVDEGCDADGDGYCDADMKFVPDDSETTCPKGGGDCWDEADSDGAAATHPVPEHSERGCVTDRDGDGRGTTEPTGPSEVDAGDDYCDDNQRAWKQTSCNSCDDADGDGYWASCDRYPGKPEDCDDSDQWTHPGAAENEDRTKCMRDADEDGYGAASTKAGVDSGSDCWDVASPADEKAKAAATHPGAASLAPQEDCTKDYDGDGYADESPPSGKGIVPGDDCWDDWGDMEAKRSAAGTYRGAAEMMASSKCTKDVDDDGYGDTTPPAGHGIESGKDCNDRVATAHPGPDLQPEKRCNAVDGDCDGTIDEKCDHDGDGYCYEGATVTPQGRQRTCSNGGGDCEDNDSSIHPGMTESCDGVDENCNGVKDDMEPSAHNSCGSNRCTYNSGDNEWCCAGSC